MKQQLPKTLFFLITLLAGAVSYGQAHPEWMQKISVRALTISQLEEGRYSVRASGDTIRVNGVVICLNNEVFEVELSKSANRIKYSSPLNSTILELEESYGKAVFRFNGTEKALADSASYKLSATGEVAVFILWTILEEIKSGPRTGTLLYGARLFGSCDHVNISFGLGSSVSASRCSYAASGFISSHSDCSQIGSCDTSCLFDNHVCFSTAVFRCRGKSCGGGNGPTGGGSWVTEYPWI